MSDLHKTERDAFETWFEPFWSGAQSDLAPWRGWQARAELERQIAESQTDRDPSPSVIPHHQ